MLRLLAFFGVSLVLAVEVAILAAMLPGCARLPVQDPPIDREHLTSVSTCDGPNRVVRYMRPDGTPFGTLVLWHDCDRAHAPRAGR